MAYHSFLEAIGNTPMVELRALDPVPGTQLYAKLEFYNPTGSLKDRIVNFMLQRAEERGELHSEMTIVEATSGNTGISLAAVAAYRGYRALIVMAENMSVERRRIMQALGAEVLLTSAAESSDGAIARAREIAQAPDHYLLGQFTNEDNVLAHYETTGPEIYEQTDGEVDVFVAGMGTTGTLMGVSQYLKEKNEKIRIVGVEPTEGHTIQGLKNMKEAIVPDIYDPARMDDKITMEDGLAFETTRRLATEEGIFGGLSGGAAVAGAIQAAADMKSGTVVTLIPDRGDRYISTMLFRSVCAKCPP